MDFLSLKWQIQEQYPNMNQERFFPQLIIEHHSAIPCYITYEFDKAKLNKHGIKYKRKCNENSCEFAFQSFPIIFSIPEF
jgi:hypothetical protein